MARLTDLEKVRRQRARRRNLRSLLAFLLFGLFVMVCVHLIRMVGDMDVKTVYSDLKAELATGEGFPQTAPGGKLGRTGNIGDSLALLYDTHLYVYNASGKQTLAAQHGMLNRELVGARDRVLLYERAGTRLALYSKTTKVQEIILPYPIYCADISDNGNFAAATGSAQDLAQVTVYHKNAQEIFKWYSSRPVIALSLANERDAMVVGCVDAAQGDFQSTLSLFQFSINKELGRVELPAGELLLALEHVGGNVRALTDRRLILFDSNLRETVSYPLGERRLVYFGGLSGKLPVLVTAGRAGDGSYTAVTLDAALQEQGRFEISEELQEVASDGAYIYAGFKERVEIYLPDGAKVATQDAQELMGIQPAGDELYYICRDTINLLKPSELQAKEMALHSSSAAESVGVSSETHAASEPHASAAPQPAQSEDHVLESAPEIVN